MYPLGVKGFLFLYIHKEKLDFLANFVWTIG